MKSFKSTPRFATINYIKNQQSDIFDQKGLNKPEVEYTHKKMMPKNTYTTSYNFLEWSEISPHQNPLIRIKESPNCLSQILNSNSSNFYRYNTNIMPGAKKRRTFYEKMFENEPDKEKNKTDLYVNARYQKETICLGDYNGDEYKIKKNKSMLYDPSPYYKRKNPLNQKMDLIYGGCDDLIGSYKPALNRNRRLMRSVSSIGLARRNFETKNDHDPKISCNAKEMKYFNLYGNKGIENSHKKLKPITTSSSTNNGYIQGEEPFNNKVNFLKSNIFNDKDVERINNNEYNIDENNKQNNSKIKVNKLKQRTKSSYMISKHINSNINENINNENHGKRFKYNHNDEKLPNKLKWNDPKLYLLPPQNKNSDVLKMNARQRKFYNIYGTEPALPKEKLCEEFKSNDRPEIEEAAKNNYNNMNYSHMKRISDNISQMQGDKFVAENSNNKSNKNFKNINKKKNNINEGISFEIKTKKNKKNISNHEIEKKFAEKGIHIYDIRENMDSVFHNKKNNKIYFKVRENNKDGNFEGKINKIKEELYNDKGLIMNEKVNKKRENTDLMPETLKWDNPYCDKLTKYTKVDKTNHGRTHSKPPLNRKNGDNKVTKIFVNLKYKNRPYNV